MVLLLLAKHLVTQSLWLFWIVVWQTFILMIATYVYLTTKRIYGKIKRIEPSNNRAILITGASSGIGLMFAKHVYEAGYTVFATYYDEKEPGYQQLTAIAGKQASNASNARMLIVRLDVRDESSVESAHKFVCDTIKERKGLKLHAVINNAGIGSLQPFAMLQTNIMRNIVETNLIGTMLVTRKFLSLLASAKGSRVINVGAGLGFIPGETYATYGASKTGLVYLTRALNYELQNEHINVKSIAFIPYNFIKDTNITKRNLENNKEAWDLLTSDEKKLYAEIYKQHMSKVSELDSITKSFSEKLSTSASTKNNKVLPPKKQSASSNPSLLQKVGSQKIALNFNSENLTLEGSTILADLDEALQSLTPPEVMFAGSELYRLIGAFILSMPGFFSHLLAKNVPESMYK